MLWRVVSPTSYQAAALRAKAPQLVTTALRATLRKRMAISDQASLRSWLSSVGSLSATPWRVSPDNVRGFSAGLGNLGGGEVHAFWKSGGVLLDELARTRGAKGKTLASRRARLALHGQELVGDRKAIGTSDPCIAG